MKSIISELYQADIEFQNSIKQQVILVLEELKDTKAEVLTLKSLIAPSEPDTDRLFSLKESAAYLKVSVPTLRNYTNKGLIATTQLSKGCNLKFKKSDLDSYLSATRKKTKAEITEIANDILSTPAVKETKQSEIDYEKLAKDCFEWKLFLTYDALAKTVRHITKCRHSLTEGYIQTMLDKQLIHRKYGNYSLIGKQLEADDFMNVEQLAKIADIPKQTLIKWIETNKKDIEHFEENGTIFIHTRDFHKKATKKAHIAVV